ncbi:MAG: hypothetical protein ACRCZD_06830 [Phycicoccus sp.]
MNTACQLPVAANIQPGEDIAGYLERLADANHLTFSELTGHQRTARVWEKPPQGLLARLALSSGIPAARLRAGTLRSAYPGMVPERARTGRRYAGQPATCPNGCVSTVAARLNLVVLCPLCRHLLVDRLDPDPPQVPERIRQVHPEVMDTLAAATRSPRARDRLRRLESLMAELEPALWDNWPPLADGETAQWRSWVVRWEKPNVIEGRYTIARPPSVTATLLALTWDASADPAHTTELLDNIAVMADQWDPHPDELPDWPTPADTYDGLLDLLEDLGIQPRHVPSILRLPDDPIILPEHQRTPRTAAAVALTVLASQVHGDPMTIAAVSDFHGATTSPRTRRVAARVLRHSHALRRLAVHARHLHDAGLRDLAHARAELHAVRRVPSTVLQRLPVAGATSVDAEVAAGWVWLDATLGRPAGGPHPHRYTAAVLKLETVLDAETKLHLRTWWQQHLTCTTDLVAADGSAEFSHQVHGSRDAG